MKKFFVLSALLLTSLVSAVRAQPISYQPIAYETLAIGSRSGCAVPAKMLISNQAEWERVWTKHMTRDEMKLSAPPVDWTRKAVVALLGGETRGGSLELQHITREAGITTIYYSASRDAGDRSAAEPFHFALIDAPTGPVKFADGNIDCSVCARIHAK